MSLKHWLRSPLAALSSRSQSRGASRSPQPAARWSNPSLRLEVLEDRLVPDSGGAAGVLSSVGNLQLNPNHLSTAGFTQVIPNVKVQLIFVTDPNGGSPLSVPVATQAALKNFFTTLTSDQYIPSLVAPYGGAAGLPAIGTGSVGVVDISAVANTDTTVLGHRAYTSGALTSLIQTEISNGNSAPSDGMNNLYFVFTPPTDAVVQGGSNSVQHFEGFHSSFLDNGKRDYYAIIPDQSSVNLKVFAAGGAANALRGETVAASHELAEAVTDPVLARGWVNPTLLGAGEVGDLTAGEVYVQDGHEVQYEWSNTLVGAAHAPGAGAADLFINQVTPPAVPLAAGTTIPVATFTTANTSLTAASFAAAVFNYDTTGHGRSDWTVTSITGGNGHFVVYARPNVAVAAGTYGLTFAQGQGLYVDVIDTSGADAAAVDGGNPISQKYAPYVVSANGPMTYTTDAGTHNLVLKENGANFELRDNGNLVLTQPVAMTTRVAVSGNGDLASVDNSLTLDYSGGVFNTVPVTFDGGNGSGRHNITVTGAALSALAYDATAANAGDFVVNGASTTPITFTHVRAATDAATAGSVALNVDPHSTISGLVSTLLTGSGSTSTATLDNGLAAFTFGNPTAVLVIMGHTGDDAVTVTSLGNGFRAALTINGNGGADIVNLNAALGLGSGASSGNVSLTAPVMNINAATLATNLGGANGSAVFNGAVTLQSDLNLTTGSGAVAFNGSLNGASALHVAGTGSTTFAAIGTATPLTALSVNGPATLGGAGVSVSGPVAFGGNVTLTTSVALRYGGAAGLQISGSTLGLGGNQLTLTDAAPTDTGTIVSQITGTGSLVKDGSGTLTLTGPVNSYSGATAVNAGTLMVDGSTAWGGMVTVASGATLGGNGTTTGPVVVGGTIAPGDGVGVLNSGDVTFTGGAVFAVQIGGPTPGTGGNHHDQLYVKGTVMIGPAVSLDLSAKGGFVPTPGQSFTILRNTGLGAIGGTFAGLAEGEAINNFLGSGLTAYITYVGGPNHNDVVISLPSNTTTSLTSSSTPSTAGQRVTLSATVSSPTGTPEGFVTFFDGTTVLSTSPLAGGVATLSVSNLSVGSHIIRAAYTGTGSFVGSSSNVTQVVNPLTTTSKLPAAISAQPHQILDPDTILGFGIFVGKTSPKGPLAKTQKSR